MLYAIYSGRMESRSVIFFRMIIGNPASNFSSFCSAVQPIQSPV